MQQRKQRKRRPAGSGRAPRPHGTTGMVRMATSMAVPGLLREHGIEPAGLLAEFGVDVADYDEPENTIPLATLCRLLNRCTEVAGCPHFGLLVGQRAGMSALGAVGFLMQSSPDVRTALGIAERRLWVHNRSATIDLVEDGSFATLNYSILHPGIEDREQLLDMSIAIAANVLRSLCGHHWRPIEVRFAHAAPRNRAPFQQFFQAPLAFDAGETALVFAADWLDKLLPSADPLLHLMMEHRVSDIELQAGEDLASQLRRMLPALVTARSASLAIAAKRVGLTVRTLNRRLAAEGTSFMKLREEARYSIARQLLQGTRMPANQIADRLGYANASAFTSAFRRWSGMGPAQWRVSRTRRVAMRSRGGRHD